MQSKTSFFNFSVFKNNSTRYWPIWGLYLAGIIFMFPMLVLSMTRYGNVGPFELNADFFEIAVCETMILLYFGLGAIYACALFNYLYTTKSAGMIGSLPISRREMYLTSYFTGVIWIVGTNLLTAVLMVMAEAITGTLMAGCVFTVFGIMILMQLFFFSFASFCAGLTGSTVILPLVYGALNFVFMVYEIFIKLVEGFFIAGVSNALNELVTVPLTPVIKFMESNLTFWYNGGRSYSYYTFADNFGNIPSDVAIKFSGFGYLICAVIVGFALVAVMTYLIKYRHMETATDIVAIKELRPVFKFCAASLCGLVLGIGFYGIIFENAGINSNVVLTICMMVFAVIGTYAAEMLIQKSFRVLNRWRDPVIAAAAILVLCVLLSFDAFGVARRMPDLDRVSSVSIDVNGTTTVFEGEENIAAVAEVHKDIVSHKGELRNKPNADDIWVRINYCDKNDKSILERGYWIKFTDKTVGSSYQKAIYDLVNSDEAVDSRLGIDKGMPTTIEINESSEEYHNKYHDDNDQAAPPRVLTGAELEKFYNECFLPDVRAGKIGRVSILDRDGTEYYDCAVYFGYSAADRDRGEITTDVEFRLPAAAERTVNYLRSIGYVLNPESTYYSN